MPSPKPITVLLVDDDRADVKAVRRAFLSQKITNSIVVAANGFEALDSLRGTNGVEKLARPYVILLDLNMPQMDGMEFLREVRADPDLRSAIVFVLTTSDHERDRDEAFEQNVAGYILKSNVGVGFVDLMKMLDAYWTLVEIPVDTTPPTFGS